MFGSSRWLAALGLAGVLLGGGDAFGQRMRPRNTSTPPTPTPAPPRATPALTIGTPAPPNIRGFPINPNPFVGYNPVTGGLQTLGQTAFNTAVMGRALSNVPPAAFGFNPFLNTVGTGPSLSPFSLSTTGGFSPWSGGGATLGASPFSGGGYSLSTTPSNNPYSTPYGGAGYGYGYQDPLGAALQGYASLTSATGGYWKDISKARLGREIANQAALDTARKRVEFERWYESTRLTAPQMRDREMATDLDRARRNPPPTEVWSGRALNELLRSIQGSKLNRAQSQALDEDMLKRINLSDKSSRGNIGMLKGDRKLAWPEALRESPFDKTRTRLTRSLNRAVDQLKDKDPLDNSQLKDIKADFADLNKTLNDSADVLSPAQYIEAKRYLNQLASAIRALSDRSAVNYFNGTWVARGKNVAELVAHMSKEGLTFAPSTPGDEAAYNALYLALRNYEAGLQTASSKEP